MRSLRSPLRTLSALPLAFAMIGCGDAGTNVELAKAPERTVTQPKPLNQVTLTRREKARTVGTSAGLTQDPSGVVH